MINSVSLSCLRFYRRSSQNGTFGRHRNTAIDICSCPPIIRFGHWRGRKGVSAVSDDLFSGLWGNVRAWRTSRKAGSLRSSSSRRWRLIMLVMFGHQTLYLFHSSQLNETLHDSFAAVLIWLFILFFLLCICYDQAHVVSKDEL